MVFSILITIDNLSRPEKMHGMSTQNLVKRVLCRILTALVVFCVNTCPVSILTPVFVFITKPVFSVLHFYMCLHPLYYKVTQNKFKMVGMLICLFCK